MNIFSNKLLESKLECLTTTWISVENGKQRWLSKKKWRRTFDSSLSGNMANAFSEAFMLGSKADLKTRSLGSFMLGCKANLEISSGEEVQEEDRLQRCQEI